MNRKMRNFFKTLISAGFLILITSCSLLNSDYRKPYETYREDLKKLDFMYDVKLKIFDTETLYNFNFYEIAFQLKDNLNIKEIILNHSTRPKPDFDSVDCGIFAILSLEDVQDDGSIKKVDIHLTEVGFSFDGPDTPWLFTNPKLADALAKYFQKAGIPKVAKLIRSKKYLYKEVK